MQRNYQNDFSRYQYGPIVQPETNSSTLTTIHHYWTHAPKSLSLKASEKSHTFKFITSIHTNKTRVSHGYSTALAMSADELYWMHSKVTVGQLLTSRPSCSLEVFEHIFSSSPARVTIIIAIECIECKI